MRSAVVAAVCPTATALSRAVDPSVSAPSGSAPASSSSFITSTRLLMAADGSGLAERPATRAGGGGGGWGVDSEQVA